MRTWLGHPTVRWRRGRHLDDWPHLLQRWHGALAAVAAIGAALMATSSQTNLEIRSEGVAEAAVGLARGDAVDEVAVLRKRQLVRQKLLVAVGKQLLRQKLLRQKLLRQKLLVRRRQFLRQSAGALAQSRRMRRRNWDAQSAPPILWAAQNAGRRSGSSCKKTGLGRGKIFSN